MNKPLVLSASRIKTYLGCSWQYFTKYRLKLPDESNSGAKRGLVCHSIFEFLLKPKHKKHYDSILSADSVLGSKAVARLISIYFKKEGLGKIDNKGEENYKLVNEMILVGLKTDFFCEGMKLEKGELEISIEDPFFRLIGFIDKTAKRQDEVFVTYDYKSSSKKDDHSLQALTYSLWCKRVMKADSVVRFLYLRFPEEPISDYSFSDEQLDGFEEFLKSLYSYLENITEEQSRENMAWAKGFPKPNEGFSKRLLCGFAKQPNQLKKDGTPMWYCSSKFGFNYYVRLNQEGKILESSKEPLDAKDGETIELREYKGCPSHQGSY